MYLEAAQKSYQLQTNFSGVLRTINGIKINNNQFFFNNFRSSHQEQKDFSKNYHKFTNIFKYKQKNQFGSFCNQFQQLNNFKNYSTPVFQKSDLKNLEFYSQKNICTNVKQQQQQQQQLNYDNFQFKLNSCRQFHTSFKYQQYDAPLINEGDEEDQGSDFLQQSQPEQTVDENIISQRKSQRPGQEGFSPDQQQIQDWLEKDCGLSVEKEVVVKLLASELEVAQIIGNKGENQKKWSLNYNIKLESTKPSEYYVQIPKRVVAISGKAMDVFSVLVGIIQVFEMRQRKEWEENPDANKVLDFTVYLIFPRPLYSQIQKENGNGIEELQQKTETSIIVQNEDEMLLDQPDRALQIQTSSPEKLLLAVAHLTAAVAKDDTGVYEEFLRKKVEKHTEYQWVANITRQMNQHKLFRNARVSVKLPVARSQKLLGQEILQKLNGMCDEVKLTYTSIYLRGTFTNVMRAQAFVAMQLYRSNYKQESGSIGRILTQSELDKQGTQKEAGDELVALLRKKL